MARFGLALVAALSLSACSLASSPSASDFTEQAAQGQDGRVRVAIIGNSITLHAPKSAIGWARANGMAASDLKHDYAHLLLQKIGASPAESYVRNFYPFETDAHGAALNIASIAPIMAGRPDVTVVQLGDNISVLNPAQLYRFRGTFATLLDMVKQSGSFYCLSTFWHHVATDYVIKSECEKAGGKYVYIGDIYPDQVASDTGSHYADKGVEKHPHDVAMQRIAFRLWKAGARI
ncbi:hypothetical protein [Sphingomonas sp.]|uniref:hypothetical protein n=1 Tax=Sphingomonas sp. TaxID=28214 RepID=UPI0025F2624C|nr:hypothetical protein [Sphingomonas sp.]